MVQPRFKQNVSGMSFDHTKKWKRARRMMAGSAVLAETEPRPKKMRKMLPFVLLVDSNPHLMKAAKKAMDAIKIDSRMTTDAEKAKDLYFYEKTQRGHVELVVTSLGVDADLLVIEGIRQHDPEATIIVILLGEDAQGAERRKRLSDAGAFAVIERRGRPTPAELRDIIAENIGPC